MPSLPTPVDQNPAVHFAPDVPAGAIPHRLRVALQLLVDGHTRIVAHLRPDVLRRLRESRLARLAEEVRDSHEPLVVTGSGEVRGDRLAADGDCRGPLPGLSPARHAAPSLSAPEFPSGRVSHYV